MVEITNLEAKEVNPKKLVNNIPLVSFDISLPAGRLTKKHAQKRALAHLRSHKVKGRDYYYYIRGVDKEIYLGDADSILRAVRGSREKGVDNA